MVIKDIRRHDRLQYLVDIGREVKPLADDEKIDDNKIRGCGNLWSVGNKNADRTMTYKHDGRLYHKRHSEDNHRHSKRRKGSRSSTTYAR